MIRITLHYFYNIGAVLSPLKDIRDQSKVIDIYSELIQAEDAVAGLLINTVMPLRTCAETGNELLRAIKAITDADFDAEKRIQWIEAYDIKNAVTRFETVLSAELQQLDTYFVSQKGGYSTIDLIAHAEVLIPESVRLDVSSEAISDFKAGGRCLAFELPTAAGFHLLRATESVLKQYYDTVATQKNLPARSTMGQMVAYLKANGGDAKVIAVLEQLTSLHRNPLMHPEDVLTMTEALILIGMVVSAIASMIDGIQKKRIADAQTQSNNNLDMEAPSAANLSAFATGAGGND